MPRLPRALVFALPLLLPSCGGGKTPSSSTSLPAASPTLASGAISLTVVDGRGQPVPNAVLRIDGVARSPRNPSGPVFEVERTLVGHALDIEREGFLLHQTFVPDRDRALDLFEVPEGAGKAWVQAFLYDGVISRSGTLARLLKPVSIVRGASIPAPTWAEVRPIWEEAADRMGAVTGYSFRLVDQVEAGSVAFTVELDPTLATGGYFDWFGTGNSIDRGTVRFRSATHLARPSLVLHELTHGFGFSHSDRTVDVMHPSAVTAEHSDRELAMVAAVKRRPAGTAFEDNVRGAATSLAATTGGQSYHCGDPR